MSEAVRLGLAAGVAAVLLAAAVQHRRTWRCGGRAGAGHSGPELALGARVAKVTEWLRGAVGGSRVEAEWRRELASFLDLLILEVEAGMGLRQAVEEAARAVRGGLRPVLDAVVRDLGMGATLLEAVEARAGEKGTGEEWHSLARGLRLGQRFGTPVVDSLRQLSADIRRRQRQDLELHLGLLPLRLGLCGLIFYLPPLLVLLLLPNVLQFVRSQW